MERFIQRFPEKIIGVLSGFDRLVIRGTLRAISLHSGMREFAYQNGVLLKDFGAYSQRVTQRIRKVSHEIAKRKGRPFLYVPSSQTDKEAIARRVLKEKPVDKGLMCMLSCVEPCMSFQIVRYPETKKIQLRAQRRMCLHIYHDLIHPLFGFMNVRFQTWFPLSIQMCINGREWLAREMDREHIEYRRLDNCFSWISDMAKAQELMNKQIQTNWPSVLNPIVKAVNPLHQEIFKTIPLKYYWSTTQSEWATDILFNSGSDLASIYSAILPHAMMSFSCKDVMRFLGRKLRGHFQGEVMSDYKERAEGIRIKHRVGSNSVKIYDKFQIVLRVETTINNPRDFRVFRPLENHPERKLAWQALRQGIADLHRRTQISQASNERYLDALAEIDSSIPLGRLIDLISLPVTVNGKRFRALRPSDPQDIALFKAVTDGRFAINGFRNRDIQQLLFERPPASDNEKRSRSARISRLIRLLRAHHLVRRVPHTYRYLLTTKGAEILSAILSMRTITLQQLKRVA
jgi:hypothetical protein